VNRTASNKESKYQFDLRYSVGLDSSEGPSIFAALPEQLGLTLKAGKAPVDTLVMSGAQRPLPN
jgi:uncharacterized protein (TIGR03435 family)